MYMSIQQVYELYRMFKSGVSNSDQPYTANRPDANPIAERMIHENWWVKIIWGGWRIESYLWLDQPYHSRSAAAPKCIVSRPRIWKNVMRIFVNFFLMTLWSWRRRLYTTYSQWHECQLRYFQSEIKRASKEWVTFFLVETKEVSYNSLSEKKLMFMLFWDYQGIIL